MTRKKLSKSQKRLNKAIRMQETQRKRIKKTMEDMERHGFYFAPSTWKTVSSEVTSNASNAMRKVNQLKKINKTSLYSKALGYIADNDQVYTGKAGVKKGRRIEMEKTRQKGIVTGLQNVDDLISTAVDYVRRDEAGNVVPEGVSVMPMKMKLANTWSNWKHEHTKLNNKGIALLNKIADELQELQTVSNDVTSYDNSVQKIVTMLTGSPMSADDINSDEEMDLNGVNTNSLKTSMAIRKLLKDE